MSKKSDYIYAVAVIHAKEKALLSDADIQNLAALRDGRAVVAALAEKGWGDGNGKISSEAMLSIEEDKTLEVLKGLNVTPEVIRTLMYPQIFHNLKAAVKEVCTDSEDLSAFYEDDEFGGEKLLSIIRDGRFDELPENMRDAAMKAKDVLLKTHDGQRCDFILDRACLEAIEEAAYGSDEFLADYAESKVVSANIKTAVRCADTHQKAEIAAEALAPCKSFDVAEMAKASENGREAVYEFLDHNGFGKAAEALKDSFSAFERWCDDRIIDTIIPQKYEIMGSGPIVAYYLARMNEIQMVRIIITAKDNGFPQETIEERLRKMYG